MKKLKIVLTFAVAAILMTAYRQCDNIYIASVFLIIGLYVSIYGYEKLNDL